MPTIVIRRSALADDDPSARVNDVTPPSVTASAPTIVSATPTEPPSPALQRALEKMREVFHIRELRPGQAEIMEAVLAGRDTLAIMPTGSGKSLTYQLPALVMDGPTLVVSPLLALIEDQYNKLKAAGVAIVRIDSTRTAKERAADLAAVREGTHQAGDDHARVGQHADDAGSAGGREVLAVLRGRGALRVAVGPRLPPVVPRAAARGRRCSGGRRSSA